jgi:V-type H+-transporting ATPase subunit D
MNSRLVVATGRLMQCKQVANKKQRDNAAQDAEMKKRREEAALRDEDQAPESSTGPADILSAEDDEDVIF